MSILIRNATILAMDNLHGSTPFTGDVLIEGDSIRQLGTGLTAPFLPAECQTKLEQMTPPSAEDFIDFAKAAYREFHDRSGRIRFMVAPSAPQRCSDTLLQAADELARQWQVPLHTHIVETKVQGCTGPAHYGKTLIEHMHDLGVLHSGVTIAHSVWVTDRDIALMGDAGVSVVHNVISNQKLGAGIAPVRKLLDAGVNLALGTDGICSNDSARMFDVMKAAGLLHNVSTPDYSRWLNASEVIRAATLGGARNALIDNITGSLEVGKRADLLILDLQSINFLPLNDIRNHLVYCENGGSIEKVIVNGEIVVDSGRLTRVDEKALLAELRELMPAFLAYHGKVEQENAALAESIAAIHRHCNGMDLGIHRLGTDSAWV